MRYTRLPEDLRRDAILAAAFRAVSRKSIAGITIRDVAAEAEVSAGLLHHHFGSKEVLLRDLLGWLGRRILSSDFHPEPSSDARSSILMLVRHEIGRAVRFPDEVQLFFDFWVQGQADPQIRERVREILRVYRKRFLPFAAALVAEEPSRYARTSAPGLAGVAASFVQGCAVQAMADPEEFDIEAHIGTAEAFLAPSEDRASLPA